MKSLSLYFLFFLLVTVDAVLLHHENEGENNAIKLSNTFEDDSNNSSNLMGVKKIVPKQKGKLRVNLENTAATTIDICTTAECVAAAPCYDTKFGGGFDALDSETLVWSGNKYSACNKKESVIITKCAPCYPDYSTTAKTINPSTFLCRSERCLQAESCFIDDGCTSLDKATMEWSGLYTTSCSKAAICSGCYPQCFIGENNTDDSSSTITTEYFCLQECINRADLCFDTGCSSLDISTQQWSTSYEVCNDVNAIACAACYPSCVFGSSSSAKTLIPILNTAIVLNNNKNDNTVDTKIDLTTTTTLCHLKGGCIS